MCCNDRTSAGVVCKDYLSLITIGETALLGVQSNFLVGLEKGKGLMVHMANM